MATFHPIFNVQQPTRFYTSTKEPQNWTKTSGIDFSNKEQVFNWFENRFADWSTDWHELFASNDVWFVARPQYYFPADRLWQTLPNLTMLGDAAHQTPPSGDGVNQAMRDALELYGDLCKEAFRTVPEALATFEKKTLNRTSVITEEALNQVEVILSKNNLQFMLDFFKGANQNSKQNLQLNGSCFSRMPW